MKPHVVSALVLLAMIFLPAAIVSAQVPIGFNWSEQVNLARDSGAVLLDSNSSATVIWDADGSGLSGWNPADPIPDGDVVVLDFNDLVMSAPFGSGAFAGQFVGNWTADDNDAWTQDGESLYLLAYVPAAYSSSGLDEYGVSSIVTISSWPNNVVSHDIVGGGPINTSAAIYVDTANTTPPWDGSPANPYQVIQDGLDAGVSGDAVVVSPGVYSGTDNVNLDFGGKDLWLQSKAGPQSTIIDGGGSGGGLILNSGETSAAVVDGFTIRNCSTSAITISGSSPTIMNCVLAGNAAGSGSAIYCAGGSTSVISNVLIVDNVCTNGTVYVDGSSPAFDNCTVSDNSASAAGGAVYCYDSIVTVYDSILWGNTAPSGHEVALTSTADPSTLTVRYSDVQGGSGEAYVETGCTLDLGPNCITLDPLFVAGMLHDYYLSQTAAGQGSDSPCVDAGSDTASNLGLDELTTRTDGADDAGTVDMGYHALYPLWITDVYWDQATTSVVLVFATEGGVDYAVETAEANAYADGLTWSASAPVTAVGSLTTVTDDLTSSPPGSDYRFYRVKRDDGSEASWQTAAVFELNLPVGFAVRQFFVSTPLIPDPDYSGVQDVISTQLNYTGAKMDKLTADSGLYTRATYTPGAPGIWANSFPIAAGEAYMLDVGNAVPTPHTVRLTGYVPPEALTVSVTRASFAVTRRWMAYSMPQATTLGALGLETAITPIWDPTNEVRLLPLGTTVWQRYFWDGADWRSGSLGGPVAGTTPIVCGQGILFIHNGLPGQPNTLTWPTWYLNPPNTW